MNERLTPKYLWETLHVIRGETALAAALASSELHTVDTQDFSDLSQANRHGELARIAVVCHTTAARRSRDLESARVHLTQATQDLVASYPLSVTQKDAEVRATYWEPVYGEENAPLMCLRDTVKLIELLHFVFPDNSQLLAIKNAFLRLLLEQTGSGTQRFDLISSVERSEYPKAREAFITFIRDFGTTSKFKQYDQILTVIGEMARRALEQKSVKDCLMCANHFFITLVDLFQAIWERPSSEKEFGPSSLAKGFEQFFLYSGFALKEIGKQYIKFLDREENPNLFNKAVHKGMSWFRPIKRWRRQTEFSSNDAEYFVEAFKQLQFVAVQTDDIRELRYETKSN